MSVMGREYCCARCHRSVVICSRCDRGNRYCSDGCAKAARRESLGRAGRRYQESRRGRFSHAARQRRYRERQAQMVTHQSSAPGLISVSLPRMNDSQGDFGAPLLGQPAICTVCAVVVTTVRRAALRNHAERHVQAHWSEP